MIAGYAGQFQAVLLILALIIAAVLYVLYLFREIQRRRRLPARFTSGFPQPPTSSTAQQPPTPADREKKEDDETFELFMLDDLDRRDEE